jgi:UDP-N-acetylglucosamine--N-acetylmuramyl-(pentapeptide) pyrophosphoryl-undecaprenol N-acetylglucosamine transferase
VVHEANAVPGLANRIGARFTDHVATTFEGSGLRNAQVLGMPLRRAISTLDRAAHRAEALERLRLRPDLPTILVTGGSLGAKRLNDTFGELVPDLAAAGIQVLHLCGRDKDVPQAAAATEAVPYRVLQYLDQMDLAYAAADFVVCRSGSGTVSEITALGLPACYVPLPIGNGEQALNARPVVAADAGLLVPDAQFQPDWVRGQILPLVRDAAALRRMGAAAAGFGIKDGDERLVRMILAAVVSGQAKR